MTVSPVPENEPLTLPVDDGAETFNSFASTLPETAQGFLDVPPSPVTESVEDAVGGGDFLGAAGTTETLPPERKRVNVTKKVRKAMNRFKTKVADVPILWFHQQAKVHPEWELDADERDLLKDAIETVFDVLDIEIEIQPLSWTLTSVWWVLSYPVLAFVYLFLVKKSMTMEHPEDENNDTVQ